jgi:para-nitrobenzyl esterase
VRLLLISYTIAAALLVSPAFGQATTGASSAPAGTAAAPATAAQPYTTSTTSIGDLLDDPAAKAVLQAHVPAIVNNDQIAQARGMTLKAIQAYAPDLTDATLAAIDADLAKLPPK